MSPARPSPYLIQRESQFTCARSCVSLADESSGIRWTGNTSDPCGSALRRSLLRALAETRRTPCIVLFFSHGQLIWKPADRQDLHLPPTILYISLGRSLLRFPAVCESAVDPTTPGRRQRHLSVWRAETATCSPPTTEQEDRDLRPGHMIFPLDQFRTRVWLGWTGPMQDPGAK